MVTNNQLALFVLSGDSEHLLPLGTGNSQPGPHHIVKEDEDVSFFLRSPEKLMKPALWLQDDVFEPTSVRQTSGGYEYRWQATNTKHSFFRNYFGTCQIVIEMELPSLQPRLSYTEVEVVATKLNAERADELLRYLESRLPDVVRSCFSRTHHGAEEGGAASTNALVLLQKIKQQMEVLTEKLPLFRNRKRYRLVPEPVLVDASTANSLSENSVAWVVSHPDLLTPATIASASSINIHNKLYNVQNVEAEMLHEETDVYENRVILGYLERVVAKLTQIEDAFRTELNEVETGSASQEIPDGYVSIADIRKKYGRKYFYRLIDLCAEVQEMCRQCIKFFRKHLSVKRSISGMPEMTPGFLSSAHYRTVFQLIVDWYRTGNVSLLGERYFLGLRSLPKLYEFFCLYRISHSLESKGLVVTETSRRDESEAFEKNVLPYDCYTLTSSTGLQLRLLYTPDIRPKAQAEDDWVDLVHRGSGAYSQYTPDFLIEVTPTTGKKTCVILDAKYTSPGQAMRTLGEDYDYADELTKLTMKYVHGIGLKRGGLSPVQALFVLHPKAFYKQQPDSFRPFHSDRYGIFSELPALPTLGAVEVTPDEDLDVNIAGDSHWLARVLDQTLRVLQTA